MEGEVKQPTVLIVVVTYESDLHEMEENLAECSAVARVVLCDNSIQPQTRAAVQSFAKSRGMHYLGMTGNRGIGYAQNRGIEFARQAAADFVLLMDDDSRMPAASMHRLLNCYFELTAGGRRVGAVSALAIDRDGAAKRPAAGRPETVVECRDLMSSGSLIPVGVFATVGFMDEGLFIDFVDFDWGWRARAHGLGLYQAQDAVFAHALGEGFVRVFGYPVKLKSPIRHYYQTRNTFRMLRRPHTPAGWKAKQLVTILIKCVVFPLFVPPRRSRLACFFQGLADGMRDWFRNQAVS